MDTQALLHLLYRMLPWVLPPVLGALIGYVTNALAIRMLFRPLRRLRFLGIPLPFTPGVIPRQREELAESIGRMVSQDLLTTDVFTDRFGSESFRRVFREGVYRLLEEISATPVSRARDVVDPLKVVDALSVLAERTVTANPEVAESLLQAVVDGIITYSDTITSGLDTVLAGVRPLRVVSDELVERLVSEVWPHLRDTAERALYDGDTQRQLQGIVRRVLAFTLDQLNSFQRLVVTAGQYERQLLARVPSIVSRMTAEIVAFLNRPETTATVTARLREWISDNREETLDTLLSPVGLNMLKLSVAEVVTDRKRVERMVRGVLVFLGGERAVGRVFGVVRQKLAEFLEKHDAIPLGQVFPALPAHKGYLARATTARAVPLLAGLAPRFVAQLNVYQVVVDRINALEVRKVEELLLGIIRRHLRWINVFGAILGSAIGAVQLLLRLFGL